MLERAYASTLAREFNMVEAEDAMRWWVVRPTRETLDFRRADRIVEFARAHGMKVRGHTLVCGRSNPSWINEYRREPRPFTSFVVERIHEYLSGGADLRSRLQPEACLRPLEIGSTGACKKPKRAPAK